MNDETHLGNNEDMWITEKKVIIPGGSDDFEYLPEDEDALNERAEENISRYYDLKERNRENVISLIESAERELADLKFRQELMEADFQQLLKHFNQVFVNEEFDASTIARSTLLEYLTFELLKPLESIGLQKSHSNFNTWDAKKFNLTYQLNNDNEIEFLFKVKAINQSMNTPSLNLLIVSPKTMQAHIDDDEVIALLRLCYVDSIYTTGQLSLLNFEINRVLARLKGLGFTVQESLLDNSNPLKLTVPSKVALSEELVDSIFVTTMASGDYDFDKINEHQLEIILDKNQTVTIIEQANRKLSVEIDTGDINRSILDFYGSYPFLVPLLVQ